MSSVAVGRLRSIAKTVRQLPTFYRVPGSMAGHYFLIVDKGAAFIREAESLGAFQGDSIYGRVGEKLAHPSCHLDEMIPIAARKVPGWKLAAWYAVVDTLAPELLRKRSRSIVRDASGDYSMRFDTSEEEAEIVARAIEAEATRIEAMSVTGGETPVCNAADDSPSPPLPDDRNLLNELVQWNAEMLETWRGRKDSYIRDYVMLGRWGQNPHHPTLGEWMLRLTYSPRCGQPDTRLRDPRLVFMLSAPVRAYLPPNRLWHCTERLRRLRENAINHNFDPRQLALDVERAVNDLFSLPESLVDRLHIAMLALPEEKAGLPKIEVDTKLSQVRYAGKAYNVTGSQTLALQEMVKADGDWISLSGLGITKPSEVMKALPEPIKSLFQSAQGKGYRFKKSE